MRYKDILDKEMNVTFDSVGYENGHEVERMWLADVTNDKYYEDYLVVKRTCYDIEKDNNGAVFAIVDNGKMLVKAPNLERYRIPESVYRIADDAFIDCPRLKELDVPYSVPFYEVDKSVKLCGHQFKIHLWNWPYNKARNKELDNEILEGIEDEFGFVYSKDKKTLLKAASVETYKIPEGVERIDRFAFVNCIFKDLHIPYTCNLKNLSDEEYPIFGNEGIQGNIMLWEQPYDKEDIIEDASIRLEETDFIDRYNVVYSNSRKRLLYANSCFDESEYYVIDGVETICSNAFAFSKKYLKLIVPSTIKVIGNNLFGEEGGKIVIR